MCGAPVRVRRLGLRRRSGSTLARRCRAVLSRNVGMRRFSEGDVASSPGRCRTRPRLHGRIVRRQRPLEARRSSRRVGPATVRRELGVAPRRRGDCDGAPVDRRGMDVRLRTRRAPRDRSVPRNRKRLVRARDRRGARLSRRTVHARSRGRGVRLDALRPQNSASCSRHCELVVSLRARRVIASLSSNPRVALSEVEARPRVFAVWIGASHLGCAQRDTKGPSTSSG